MMATWIHPIVTASAVIIGASISFGLFRAMVTSNRERLVALETWRLKMNGSGGSLTPYVHRDECRAWREVEEEKMVGIAEQLDETTRLVRRVNRRLENYMLYQLMHKEGLTLREAERQLEAGEE